MPTYRVTGAFRENGEDTWITLTAANKAEATARANAMGILVADVDKVPDAIAAPPTNPHAAPARIPGKPVCPLCSQHLRRCFAGPTSASIIGGVLVSAAIIVCVIITPVFLHTELWYDLKMANDITFVAIGVQTVLLIAVAVRSSYGPKRLKCDACGYKTPA